MSGSETVTKLIVIALFFNVIFGIIGYFGVVSSLNSINTLNNTFNTIHISINNTQTALNSNINATLSSSASVFTIASGLGGIIYNLIIFILIGIGFILFLMFGFVPTLVSIGIGGGVGAILSFIIFAVDLIVVGYAVYEVLAIIRGNK